MQIYSVVLLCLFWVFFLFCFFFPDLNLTSKFITYYRYTNNSSSTLPHPPPNIEMTREGTNPPITLSPLLNLFITSPLRSAKLAFLYDTFIYSHLIIFTVNPPSPPSLSTSLLQSIFNVTILSPISFWRVGGGVGGVPWSLVTVPYLLCAGSPCWLVAGLELCTQPG